MNDAARKAAMEAILDALARHHVSAGQRLRYAIGAALRDMETGVHHDAQHRHRVVMDSLQNQHTVALAQLQRQVDALKAKAAALDQLVAARVQQAAYMRCDTSARGLRGPDVQSAMDQAWRAARIASGQGPGAFSDFGG
jgi:hypothetical protein